MLSEIGARMYTNLNTTFTYKGAVTCFSTSSRSAGEHLLGKIQSLCTQEGLMQELLKVVFERFHVPNVNKPGLKIKITTISHAFWERPHGHGQQCGDWGREGSIRGNKW